MKKSDFTVGQKLIYVTASRRGNNPREFVVKKIGRTWITAGPVDAKNHLQDHRFDPETMFSDGRGYSSPGRFYLSLEQFEEEMAVSGLWGELRDLVTYGRSGKCKKLSSSELRDIIGRIKIADSETPTQSG